MTLVQGGPPEWVWERPEEQLCWEILRTRPTEEHDGYELRVHCGLELVRLQFFTSEEIAELHSALTELDAVRQV